jgi:hypothetical protein
MIDVLPIVRGDFGTILVEDAVVWGRSAAATHCPAKAAVEDLATESYQPAIKSCRARSRIL